MDINNKHEVALRDPEAGGRQDYFTLKQIKGFTAAKTGTPIEPVAATGVTGTTNYLTYTAKVAGADGNAIQVNILAPIEATEEITISVIGSVISIIAASTAETISSTLTQIKAAIDAHDEAKLLVSAAITGAGTTKATAKAVTLSGGVDGIEGIAGELMVDANNLYITPTASTKAVNNWKSIAFTVE